MRVFASRGMPTTFAALAAAAAERDAAMDLVKRFVARATREGTSAMRAKKSAGGPASFRAFADDRGHAWSRALWRDLASLAGPDGVFGEHFSREDAAAELLCALLRIGGGAERSPLARRILSKVFSDGDGDDDGDDAAAGASASAASSDAREGSHATHNTNTTTNVAAARADVSVRDAVGAVAGQAAGELVSVAGGVATAFAGRVGQAVGGVVRGRGAAGGPTPSNIARAVGGIVGGLGQAAVELGAAGVGVATGHLGGGGAGGDAPPAIASKRASRIVVDAAREALFAASDASDEAALSQADAVLRCAPTSTTTTISGEADDDAAADAMTELDDARASLRLVRALPSFGVSIAPLELTKIRDPMEIVRACLRGGGDAKAKAKAAAPAYARVDELCWIAEAATRAGEGAEGRERRSRKQTTRLLATRACARAAMDAGDVAAAANATVALVTANYADAWDVAHDVAVAMLGGSNDDDDDDDDADDDARRLLSFALTHCPPDRVAGILSLWQSLESDRLVAAAGVPGTPRTRAGRRRELDDRESAAWTRVAGPEGAFSSNWFPYDRVGGVNADPEGLFFPACLSAHHPSLSIPALDAFQLHLMTPFNSTPTFVASYPSPSRHRATRREDARVRPRAARRASRRGRHLARWRRREGVRRAGVRTWTARRRGDGRRDDADRI